MPTLLVTGFGPFPSMPRNPSAALALRVAAATRWRRIGAEPRCRILTTAYGALATELAPALAEGPDAVLMIGVAGRSPIVRVERRATSRRSRLFADVAGETASSGRGADARVTRAAAIAALRILRRFHVPSRLSRDAGRYLCNASYFQALAEPAPTLFIHVPKPRVPRPRRVVHARRRLSETERLEAALVEIGVALLAGARRVESTRSLR